jgi:hypothetical protein
VVVIEEPTIDEGKKKTTSNIFITIMLSALGIVAISVLAIVLTNTYLKRKR